MCSFKVSLDSVVRIKTKRIQTTKHLRNNKKCLYFGGDTAIFKQYVKNKSDRKIAKIYMNKPAMMSVGHHQVV